MTRIFITGASGSGVTTLGGALASELGYPQHDVDDLFWEPTDPPFQRARPLADRQRDLRAVVEGSDRWVLSGSCDGWGDVATPRMELVVFLWVPPAVRLARLRERELARYGAAALARGGAMYPASAEFLAWAERYDSAGMEQRSRARHEAWLATLLCPVVRIEGDTSVAERMARVLAGLGGND